MGQRWRKKYIIAAMMSNASRKRKMVQLLLVSGVIGELSIASAALPKLAFAVFGHPISHLLSWRHRFESRPAGGRSRAMPRLNVCEPAFTVKPVFRFTNTLISPELPCAASACDSSGMKCFPTKAMLLRIGSRSLHALLLR